MKSRKMKLFWKSQCQKLFAVCFSCSEVSIADSLSGCAIKRCKHLSITTYCWNAYAVCNKFPDEETREDTCGAGLQLSIVSQVQKHVPPDDLRSEADCPLATCNEPSCHSIQQSQSFSRRIYPQTRVCFVLTMSRPYTNFGVKVCCLQKPCFRLR